MKKIKSVAALVLALIMLLTTSACSGDTTWSIKEGDTTFPIGVYIYNTYAAYYQASYTVSDSSTPVMDQKIDDKPVSDWIQEKALESCKSILYTQKKFQEMGLSFTDEEQAALKNQLESNWAQASTLMEKIGVAKESLNIASIMQQAQYVKIFQAIYGKDGSEAVSDADLESYLVDNYTHYAYFTKALTKTEDDSTVNLSDEEIEEIKKEFEGYADSINNDGKKPDDVAKTYQDKEKLESSPLHDNTLILKDSTLSDDLKKAIEDLDNGKAAAVKVGTTYYLLYKYDIKDSVSDLKDANKRDTYLSKMKGEEFDTMMSENANALEVQVNNNAIKKYSPERLVKEISKS